MEEDDQNELLQASDDDSLSETEDQCLPSDKAEDEPTQTTVYFSHTKLEFLVTKTILIISSFILLIMFPLYLDSVNVKANAYSLLFVTTVVACIIFTSLVVMAKYCFENCKNIKILHCPVKFSKLLEICVFYFLCGFMVVYALDRKRVVCHLQDPMKGVVLVFSLLYYFFFCQKFMGLQRIFSSTTIIVGLFIAVDYGLCDEFRCRGYERRHVTDDTGIWSWQSHAAWTAIYIIGLALFAATFAVLERVVLGSKDSGFQTLSEAPSRFLSTVSRTVSFPGTNSSVYTSQLIVGNGAQANGPEHLTKRISALHLTMWIHIIGLVIVVALFWTDFSPVIGKGTNALESWNNTLNGIACHFVLAKYDLECGNVVTFGWLFIAVYVVFILAAIRFLILCQSGVYTIATIASSLALVGIWWSLFYVTPEKHSVLVWAPRITGELICSLLGVPIIGLGLYFLGKAHFLDYHLSRRASTQIAASFRPA